MSPFDAAATRSGADVKTAALRIAARNAAFQRFIAAYPCVQSPTDRVLLAFDRAAAPFTDPGVIVAAAEMFAIAVRAGEVLDREVPTDVFWLESGQFKAWIPPSPGGGMPPAMAPTPPAPKREVPVRVDIGGSTINELIRAEAENDVFVAILLLLCGAASAPPSNPERDRCGS